MSCRESIELVGARTRRTGRAAFCFFLALALAGCEGPPGMSGRPAEKTAAAPEAAPESHAQAREGETKGVPEPVKEPAVSVPVARARGVTPRAAPAAERLAPREEGFREGFEGEGMGLFAVAAWKGKGSGRLTDRAAHSGKCCVELTGGEGTDDVTVLAWHGPALRFMPGEEYVASVWVKTENAESVNLRVSLPNEAGAKGLGWQAVRGTSDWRKLEQRFTVSAPARPRYIAVWMQGPGKAWADDFALEGKTGGIEWEKTVEIDPAGVKTEKEFNALLGRHGLATKGYVNYFTGRWPNISFIGGMAMGNVSEHLEFFYEKPFRWWTHVLDYVMEGGGRRFGVRARIRRYKEQGKVEGRRSFLLWYRCDRLLADYHPSYILANGRRVWDSKVHPCLDGKIMVPFWQEEPGDPVIDFVIDLDHTPEVKGLAFRMFHVQYLGESGVKVGLKGASSTKEPSPADPLERFTFGLFPSGYDFWTEQGPRIEDLKKSWKPNFRPKYPVDDVWLCPVVFGGKGSGTYHDFMVTYGGCTVLGTNPAPGIVKEAGYLRAVLAKARDAGAARKVLAIGPDVEAHWFSGEAGALVSHAGDTDAARLGRMAHAKRAIEEAKKSTGAPERVRYIYEPFPPALTTAHEYERGADILVLKNEEDPQYNVMMSMARGAGRSFAKPFGFYWEQTHYPYPSLDFKLHACLLYYLSGGSWIGAEAEGAHSFSKGVVADWVLPYVKACRFAMMHPARGEPVVPVAVLWGYGDRWWVPYNVFGEMDTFQRHIEYEHATKTLKCEPAFVKPFDWMPKNRAEWRWTNVGHLGYFAAHVRELKGYDLLDVFFPEYGDAFTARITRLLTGTPYGPVDLVYANAAPPELLKSYGLAVVLGHMTMTPDIEKKLTGMVESGVALVIGAQHLKGGGGAFGLKIASRAPASVRGPVTGIRELFDGARGGSFAARAYEAEGRGWETVARVGSKPLVLRGKLGDGAVYVYLGEWIADGGAALRPILKALAGRAAPLRFSPPVCSPHNDQIEYVAYRKAGGAWVALFNHGNIPVGCDRLKELRVVPPEPLVSEVKGSWRGEIAFRLDRLGLETRGAWDLYEVEGIDEPAFDELVSGHAAFKLKRIRATTSGGSLRARVEVSKRAQFVVAPRGRGEAVFFGGR